MKAMELAEALRDIAAIYGNLDVVFINHSGNYDLEIISVDSILVRNNILELDEGWVAEELKEKDSFVVDVDFAYRVGGEWIDGKTG